MPRSRVYRLLRRGEVRVNGKRKQADYRLAAEDEVRLPPLRDRRRPSPGRRVFPTRSWPSCGMPIVHEDPRLLVLNKPAGLAVHGGAGLAFGVIEALRALRPDESLELVHRLDRDTSGCLLVARKRAALVSCTRPPARRRGRETLRRPRRRALARSAQDDRRARTHRMRARVASVSCECIAAARSPCPSSIRCAISAISRRAWTSHPDRPYPPDPRARGFRGTSGRGRREIRQPRIQRAPARARPSPHVPACRVGVIPLAGRRDGISRGGAIAGGARSGAREAPAGVRLRPRRARTDRGPRRAAPRRAR